MIEYDASSASCSVFTFKEGLLSKVAHDLELEVTRFSLRMEDDSSRVRAEFDPASLRVVSALEGGVRAPAKLSQSDRRGIERHVVVDVLEAARHPSIVFDSESVTADSGGGLHVVGQLELHGVRRRLEVTTRIESGRHLLEVDLFQPDFGIVPFRALMGTLKVQPRVRVRLSVPRSPPR